MTMPINDDNSDCDDQQHTASLGLFMMTIMQNPIILMTMPINDDGNGGSYANAEPDADD